MVDSHTDTGAPARLGRWVSGALMLLGLVGLAWAGYAYWESRSIPDTPSSSERSELIVDNPDYVVPPPIKSGMLYATFTLRNPGSRPTRVVGAGDFCTENVCPVRIEGVPMVIPPGESRQLVVGCGVKLFGRDAFSVSVPVYYESAPGTLEIIELSISGRNPPDLNVPRDTKKSE
ncbi:MAG: hypothetical protein HYS12_11695 [Planctomycetes bacterium]|nr:hypothetical protein [Planctomycetota bacterium]